MNKVILIGRLTRNPEMRYTTNNTPVATFNLAVSRPFIKEDGEREADFINCVVWKKAAENVNKYLKQGDQAAVEGSIQTRNYDAEDGTKRYVTEVLAQRVEFITTKKEETQEESKEETKEEPESQFAGFGEQIKLTKEELEDLPF